MPTFDGVYQKWKNETCISQEISDLFDADKMVDDFGKMIPAFFFRFVWEESNPYIYIYIRYGRLPSNVSYMVSSSDKLSKLIDRFNLNNNTFHYSDTGNLPNWWRESLTQTEITSIKKKRENILQQITRDVINDMRNNTLIS